MEFQSACNCPGSNQALKSIKITWGAFKNLVTKLHTIPVKPEFLHLRARRKYLRWSADSIVPQSLETTSLCKPSHDGTQGVEYNKVSEVEK